MVLLGKWKVKMELLITVSRIVTSELEFDPDKNYCKVGYFVFDMLQIQIILIINMFCYQMFATKHNFKNVGMQWSCFF